MRLTVNGAIHQAADAATIAALLAELLLSANAGFAIAVNETVIPRGTWPQFVLNEGDQVLIIQATQGG